MTCLIQFVLNCSDHIKVFDINRTEFALINIETHGIYKTIECNFSGSSLLLPNKPYGFYLFAVFIVELK